MARTFIDYKDEKGFEINEAFMQLALNYIYYEANKAQYSFLNKDDLMYDFETSINGYRNGYLVLNWNDYLANQTEEQTMVEVLENVKSNLQVKGSYISVSELRSIPSDDSGFKHLYSRKPFPTAELIKIIDALIKMLQGTWDLNNYSMDINYQY